MRGWGEAQGVVIYIWCALELTCLKLGNAHIFTGINSEVQLILWGQKYETIESKNTKLLDKKAKKN